jgi:FtsP/CotA-like multicopper oxidase with cupredoxin domain
VPGPTIEARAGVKTYVRWENRLPDRHILAVDLTLGGSTPNSTRAGVPTVVHVHGGATEPASDGHALAWFTRAFALRGPTWTKPVYEYANVPETSSLWYHDHADAFTRLNLLAGLVGAYKVVRPELERDAWKLPRGRLEAVLLIQDRAFTKDGQIYMNATGNNPRIHPQWQVIVIELHATRTRAISFRHDTISTRSTDRF